VAQSLDDDVPYVLWDSNDYSRVGKKELLARVKAVFYLALNLGSALFITPIELTRLNFHFITTRPIRIAQIAKVNYAFLKTITVAILCLAGSILSPRTCCSYIQSEAIIKTALATIMTELPQNLNEIAQAVGVDLGTLPGAPERLRDWRAKFAEILLASNITQANALWPSPANLESFGYEVFRYPFYQLLRERYPAPPAGEHDIVADFFHDVPAQNVPLLPQVKLLPRLQNIFTHRLFQGREYQFYEVIFKAFESARDDLVQSGWTREELSEFLGDAYNALLGMTLFKLATSGVVVGDVRHETVSITIAGKTIVLSGQTDLHHMFTILRDQVEHIGAFNMAQKALLKEVLDRRHQNGQALTALDNAMGYNLAPLADEAYSLHDVFDAITDCSLRSPFVHEVLPAMAEAYGRRFSIASLFAVQHPAELHRGPIIP